MTYDRLEPRETDTVMMNRSLKYAVLFKTHFWDDFVERQFRRLCLHAGGGSVFVIADETRGAVPGIWHENVIRMTEAMSEDEGYLVYPAGNSFWYNTDYQVYHFFDKHPEFEFVFMCEYDCYVNVDVSTVIQTMARHNLGFVGERIHVPLDSWHWTQFARPYYTEQLDFAGRLLCCAAFSLDFARQLQSARRDHTRLALSSDRSDSPDAIVWPNNEAVVGAEIARLGVMEAPLSAFGDVSRYDWAPPYPEFALAALSNCAVVHPVLDSRRYLRAIEKVNWTAEDLFRDGSPLQLEMERYDPAFVVPMFLQYFTETKNPDGVERLHHYAKRRSGSAARGLFNVARGKPATQSSRSPWSLATLAQDAAGAVNGQVTGKFGFHTNLDEEPWWCIDLESVFPVTEICIYNRMERPSRSRSLTGLYSCDLVIWRKLFQHDGRDDFGGADGNPLRIELVDPVNMRFLRVHLPEEGVLHLDEIEIYV